VSRTVRSRRIAFVGIALMLCRLTLAADERSAAKTSLDDGLHKIQHIVVIYAENRSFDNLYGLFPGANGIAQATPEQYRQKDRDGISTLDTLPPVWPDARHPSLGPTEHTSGLPNRPFRIDAPPIDYPLNIPTRDLVHRYYQHIEQINGGRNDMFVALSDAGALAMGYYDGSLLPMWQYARQYTLADNFFMGAFGGSFVNHLYLVCACVAHYPGAPEKLKAAVTQNGRLEMATDAPKRAMDGPPKWKHDGAITPDDYAVNTMEPPYQPSGVPPAKDGDPAYADTRGDPSHVLPAQSMETIGDTLSAKNISWAWYGAGWDQALADSVLDVNARRVIKWTAAGSINFQTHHQPFNYFRQFAPGTAARSAHLRDGSDFFSALDAGTLPQVSFYKPAGYLNEHPGYTDVMSGDAHIAAIIARIQASSVWSSVAIVVTYDENGGFWDHVAPPKGDRWGPGTRVPAIIISPYAKKGFVDHTPYDTGSILKFITRRFDLKPLAGVRSDAGDLTNAFAF